MISIVGKVLDAGSLVFQSVQQNLGKQSLYPFNIIQIFPKERNQPQKLTKHAINFFHFPQILQEFTTQEAVSVSWKCSCPVDNIFFNLDQLPIRWTSDKRKQGKGFDCRVNCRFRAFSCQVKSFGSFQC